MYLLCGLGNPGKQYTHTRHNVGFKLIDKLVSFYEIEEFKNNDSRIVYKGKINNEDVILFKSLNYMNRTGVDLKTFINFFKINLSEIIVIHDDLDIKFGNIKYKLGGGNGGHRGLESIDQNIGNEYARIRIGIGHPGNKNLVDKYVLENFTTEENVLLNKKVGIICKNILLLLKDEKDKFLSKIAEEEN